MQGTYRMIRLKQVRDGGACSFKALCVSKEVIHTEHWTLDTGHENRTGFISDVLGIRLPMYLIDLPECLEG